MFTYSPMKKQKKSETKAPVVTLTPKQWEAFDFKTQFCAAIAGVRGGKTYVGSAWAGHKIASDPSNGLITAPDYKTLHDATLDTFFRMFPGYRKFYRQQKSLIELPDKTIFLRSLDDPLAAEGLTAGWFWGDEAGKYKLMAWHALRSRVSLVKGQGLLTTTPYNMGWLYQDFYKPWLDKTDPDLTVVSWASIDNPFFPKEVYDAEKKRLSPQEFKRRYEGVFSRMSGLVYSLSQWHIFDKEEGKTEITIGGIDWGWSNPAALVIIKIIDGAYYIMDEWYETEKTTTQIIEQCIHLQNKWGVNRWYADSANPEKVAEANTNTGLYVLGYEKKKDALMFGINYINQQFLENRLFIKRGLPNIISEFETYQYPERNEDGKVTKDEPMPFNNHLMDAMRYAIMGFQPAMRARVPKSDESNMSSALRRMLGGGGNNSTGGDDFI